MKIWTVMVGIAVCALAFWVLRPDPPMPPIHMVNIVRVGPDLVVIIDPNKPDDFVWMTDSQFAELLKSREMVAQ